MTILEIAFVIFIAVAAIVLTIVVLMQSSKESGLSGAISGTAASNGGGKGQSRSRGALLNKITIIMAVVFAVAVIAFYIIQPTKSRLDFGDKDAIYKDTTPVATTADTSEAETSSEAVTSSEPVTSEAEASSEGTPETTAPAES